MATINANTSTYFLVLKLNLSLRQRQPNLSSHLIDFAPTLLNTACILILSLTLAKNNCYILIIPYLRFILLIVHTTHSLQADPRRTNRKLFLILDLVLLHQPKVLLRWMQRDFERPETARLELLELFWALYRRCCWALILLSHVGVLFNDVGFIGRGRGCCIIR